MDRRTFLGWVGVGGLASYFPVALAACTAEDSQTTPGATTPESPTVSPVAARSDGFAEVGTVKDLDSQGFLKQGQDFPGGPLVVIRDPKDANKLVALNPTCSHKQCPVDWKADESLLVCPCHGSKFKPDGSVANGPAAQPLTPLTAKLEGDKVLVKSA
jgi:cytochrome b6-f complex iron-sulfur subunit